MPILSHRMCAPLFAGNTQKILQEYHTYVEPLETELLMVTFFWMAKGLPVKAQKIFI